MLSQKGNPYLDDANELIEIARESGLIDAQFQKYIPYAAKCLTHADVKHSHIGKDNKVVFKLENFYGMIILLGIGLGGGVLTLIAEIFINKVGCKKEEANKVILI